MRDDSGLRELFREAREADERSAPAFRVVRRRSLRHPIQRRWPEYAVGSVIAALALLVALVWPKASEKAPGGLSRAESNATSFEQWTAPTDFLLETPGRELLISTPAIGLGIPESSDVKPLSNPKGTRT